MKEFYVYLHCRPGGDPFYVGKGSGRRSREFVISRTPHHRHIVEKYGRENIEVFVFPQESERAALDTESLWINRLRDAGISLINLTSGGIEQAGYKHTPEARATMSLKLLGNSRSLGKRLSTETRELLSRINIGKRQSAETIAKRVAKNKGKKRTPEQIALMRKPRGPCNLSPEQRARFSEIAKARTYSAETRAKMSASHRARHQQQAVSA